jgi:hypothetical protein
MYFPCYLFLDSAAQTGKGRIPQPQSNPTNLEEIISSARGVVSIVFGSFDGSGNEWPSLTLPHYLFGSVASRSTPLAPHFSHQQVSAQVQPQIGGS